MQIKRDRPAAEDISWREGGVFYFDLSIDWSIDNGDKTQK
jgi:hypothetical protein